MSILLSEYQNSNKYPSESNICCSLNCWRWVGHELSNPPKLSTVYVKLLRTFHDFHSVANLFANYVLVNQQYQYTNMLSQNFPHKLPFSNLNTKVLPYMVPPVLYPHIVTSIGLCV